ncbi:hypothetical protein IW262DRAFT_680987 [Armillaria fumosa]|nr:hypothetical protein IW262DRAFT_680987 [Armillaria fumosa]
MLSLTQLPVECANGTESYVAPNQDTVGSILGLFECSSCSSTLLRLCDVRITLYDVRSLFTRLPILEDLRLANVGNDTITNTILHELVASINKSSPAFPKLHALHVDGVGGFKPANFIKTLRSGCTFSTGYAQLRSVRAVWEAGVMENRARAVASQLKDCKANGLELSSFVSQKASSR